MVHRACWLAALVIAATQAFDALPGQALTTEEQTRLVGDRTAWDAIFVDDLPELVAEGFAWPEGPLWIEEDGALLFSDTITGKLHCFRDGTVDVLREHAGGCAVDVEGGCDPEQLEPGSNGLALVGKRLVVCQHGARRLVFLDLETGTAEVIVDRARRKRGTSRGRLNGPNDVVASEDGATLYFTDPYYALLEKTRPADGRYADAKSELGSAGIYRYDVRKKDLELLDDTLSRPNGLAIVNGSHLVVSDCCQGHSRACPAGEARWAVWPFREDGYLSKRKEKRTIVHRDFVKKGCADGLAFHEPSQTLVASCPGGVCLVDLDAGDVVAKLHLGRSVSNVAFGGGYAWITADKSLWRARLREDRVERRREL